MTIRSFVTLSPLLFACALAVVTAHGEETAQKYPDVIGVEVEPEASGSYLFSVTLSSPYDSPQRYADAFRIRTADGTQLGVRQLLHHHADEQPFTRRLGGVEIPEDVDTVVVEGRDQKHGYGGGVKEVRLPER
ncbi:hypothetical protein SAMN05216203_0434 [Marinobacter daqiaonensis]|uniref:Uncharacterized protein n=1 Tax=Marinobacter daqiaonensis TaxID=650891 RepID=A0A1I6GSF9_9GAMM|nr:hypothetical protein [Marinobacter daqiaonensis]SFR45175.1 hypothetical protein SAMN05216203_0434 [Marinobacter daqiaonensis]